MDELIEQLLLDTTKNWIDMVSEHYDDFESHLFQLQPEADESHAEVQEWEENERQDYQMLAEAMHEKSAEDGDFKLDVAACEHFAAGDVVKIALPNLPHNSGPDWQFEELTLQLIGEILQRVRALNQKAVVTLTVNRSSLLKTDADDDDDVTQNALNAARKTGAKMLHNFVCFLSCRSVTPVCFCFLSDVSLDYGFPNHKERDQPSFGARSSFQTTRSRRRHIASRSHS